MDTLFLRPDRWDLTLDASGNIALASKPYALAQDAASAIRTVEGECYYDTTLGIPYFTQVFRDQMPIPLFRAKCVAAALAVPEVVKAEVFFTALTDRTLFGQVQCYDTAGTLSIVGF